jgi:transposase
MKPNLFWLSDEQWTRIEPHLPTDVRGKPRVASALMKIDPCVLRKTDPPMKLGGAGIGRLRNCMEIRA